MKLIARFKRHIIQLLAALLYNLNFEGFATGTIYQGSSKGICVPGLNCYSCPGAIGACPIGSLQAALVASDQKLPLYVIGTILAFGALLGRTVCGWLCPFGLIQDLLDKAPLPKVRKGSLEPGVFLGQVRHPHRARDHRPACSSGCDRRRHTGVLRPPLPDPGTLEAGIPLVTMNEGLRFMLGSLFNWKVGVLVALVLVSLFVYRPFCRFLCPLGALYSFFNRFALLRYRVDNEACTSCGACLAVCKVDIRTVSDRECIQCGACVTSCETNAIRFSLRDMLANNLHLDGSRRDDAARSVKELS